MAERGGGGHRLQRSPPPGRGEDVRCPRAGKKPSHLSRRRGFRHDRGAAPGELREPRRCALLLEAPHQRRRRQARPGRRRAVLHREVPCHAPSTTRQCRQGEVLGAPRRGRVRGLQEPRQEGRQVGPQGVPAGPPSRLRDLGGGRGGRLVTVHSLNLGILHALRCATESLTPGSLLPSLRIGETLSSLRVRYAPFGEIPRVLPRSGSSLAHL
mmetsp:Transcript_17909/g.58962  ORF Transcript_17909/g.58962 Transcript_17909/m.58962 type:complete len:212 (-) Transcript_17909:1993-2628(-)